MIGGERMNGFCLVIPLLIIRFGWLSFLNKQAVQRAGYFAPVQAGEVLPFYIYQVSNVILFLYLFWTKIEADFSIYFYAGIICYCIGIILCLIATMNFAFPNIEGLNTNGLYHFSRNPMYIAYFVYFLGTCLLTQSGILFAILMCFQISAHWIILSEERWCIEKFGDSYKEYMAKVPRYL